MLNHLKSLSKDSFAYSISNIVTRASSFILLPVYARLFAPADIGVVNLINVTFFFISSVMLFCLDSAAVVFYWKDGITSKAKIFSSWFWFVFLVNAILCLFVFCFSNSLSKLVLSDSGYGIHFTLTFVAGLFNIVPLIYSNFLRITRHPFTQLKIALLTALMNLFFTYLFLFYLKSGLIGIFYSQLCAAFVNGVVCCWLFRKQLSIKLFDWPLLKQMLSFSIPVIPTTITFWLSNSISLYSISYFFDKHEVGLYNVASSIASIINILISAISQAVLPFALSINKEEQAKAIYSKIFQTYYLTLGFIGLLISVFSKEILSIIATNKYSESELVLIFLVFNSVLIGSNTIAGIGLNVAQKMKSLFKVSVICTLSNIAFVFILVPLIGKEGAAIAAMISNIFLVVLTMRSSQKYYFVPYNYIVPAVSFLAYLSFSLLFYLGLNDFSVKVLLIKSVLCMAVLTTLFYHTKKTFSVA